jgi:hypothetical protein
VSTVQEIEQAIERLSDAQRDELESRLLARRFGLETLTETERTELMASLEQAEREINDGRSYSGNELRQAVRSWLGK